MDVNAKLHRAVLSLQMVLLRLGVFYSLIVEKHKRRCLESITLLSRYIINYSSCELQFLFAFSFIYCTIIAQFLLFATLLSISS